MPIYTFSYCLICYRKEDPLPVATATSVSTSMENLDQSINNEEGGTVPKLAAFQQMTRKREVCRRFCTLASRYLGIDPYHYNPDKTLYSKFNVNTDHVCDSCFPALKSFCDIYESWHYLQLQLDHRAKEIAVLMKAAETEHASAKNDLLKQMADIGEKPDDLHDFRNEYLTCAGRRHYECFPRLPMVLEKMEADPDFEVIFVKKVVNNKTRKRKSNDVKVKVERPSPAPTPPSTPDKFLDHETPSNLNDSRKRDRTISGSSDDSMFTKVIVKKKKKNKKRKVENAESKNNNDSLNKPNVVVAPKIRVKKKMKVMNRSENGGGRGSSNSNSTEVMSLSLSVNHTEDIIDQDYSENRRSSPRKRKGTSSPPSK